MGKIIYKTKQRDEILKIFENHKDSCFSAKDIFGMVDAGETTVFRTLSSLCEEGIIEKYVSGTGTHDSSCYKYNNCNDTDHIHMMCSKCGKLFHADCKFIKSLEEHFMSEHDFSLDRSKTVIYGLCKDCRNQGVNDNE